MKDKVIIIVGPTASGKTSLGVKIASEFNGEIISADSRQVFKSLDIGTGKDLKEYGKIKHHLIDICDPMDEFTLFDWLEMANKKIEELLSDGKLPIVVGGTGLYIQALVEGFGYENQKINTLKKHSRDELESKSNEDLIKILKKLDEKSMDKIDTNNSRRLIRAIEIRQEGKIPVKNGSRFNFLQIGLNLDREILYKRIDRRVEDRFKEGMLEEVKKLSEEGVDYSWLQRLGLEYRIISSYLKMGGNFEEIKQELKFKSHAYARRQMTWFNRFREIKWVSNFIDAKKEIAAFLAQ